MSAKVDIFSKFHLLFLKNKRRFQNGFEDLAHITKYVFQFSSFGRMYKINISNILEEDIFSERQI